MIYTHQAQYYETDQMGIIHHSNYIRWMEEARTDYLDAVGVSYAEMERRGIISPVLTVSCQYHTMTRYGESVRVETRLTEMGSVRYRLSYRIVDAETGELRAVGESSHCFINPENRVISLKKADPEAFERMREKVENA